MKKLPVICLALLVVLSALPVFAGELKVYIAEGSVVGLPNRDEMQAALRKLLASRLSGDGLVSVASPAEADAVVTASYVVADGMFSLDAVGTVAGSPVLLRAFVQGESRSELIPAIGKLAEKLAVELAKVRLALSGPPPAPGSKSPSAGETGAVGREAAPVARDIVRISEKVKGERVSWRSQVLPGAMNLVVAGATRSDGRRDIFLADNRHLFYYRQGKDLRLVARKELQLYEKIVALDALDAGNGNLDIYLTVERNRKLASKVWQAKGDSLESVADDLPYFFRTVAARGAPGKLYAQKAGRELSFAGDVFEAERRGADIVLKKTLNLPPGAAIYSFSRFADRNNTVYTAVLSPENKLIVYDPEQRELWRSTEKYGGSELFMGNSNMEKSPGVKLPNQGAAQLFMNQRMQATPACDVLIGRNEALVAVQARNMSYRNGLVYCLAWNGYSLEGKWRTLTTENYMPDFYFDETRQDLLQLDLSQRPNILSSGTSTLTIRKVE